MRISDIRKGTKCLLLVFLLSVFLPAGTIFAEENSGETVDEDYIDIIVRYEEVVPEEDTLDDRFKNIKTMDVLPIQTMSVPTSTVKDISLQKNVRRITYDQEVVTSQSSYEVSSDDWNQDMIGTFDGWKEGYTGKNVNVAILDTGFYQHPEITYSGGHSIFGEESELGADPWTNDHSGHGTHVAGIIGAEKGSRTQGVAPGIDLYGVKVYHESKGSKTRVGNLLQGLNWAINNGSDIIIISSGYAHPNNEVHEVIKLAASKGIMTIAASGNMTEENVTTDYPAAHPEVIAVSSVDRNQAHVSDSMIASENELAAPGQNILSLSPDGTHAAMSGTSQATPHVAGIAALLMEKYPNESASSIRQRMIDHALDLGDTGRDLIYGYGLVQYSKKTLEDKPLEEIPNKKPDKTEDVKEEPNEEPQDKDQSNSEKTPETTKENKTKETDDKINKETRKETKDPAESEDVEKEKSEDVQSKDKSPESDGQEKSDEEGQKVTEDNEKTTENESSEKKAEEQSVQQKTVWIRPSTTDDVASVADEDIETVAESGVLAVSLDASLDHIERIRLSREQVETLREKNIILLIARADLEWVIPSSNLSNSNAEITFEQTNQAISFDSITKGDVLSFSIKQDGKRLTEFPSQMTYRLFTPKAEYNKDALYQWSESEGKWNLLGDAYTKGGVVGVTKDTPTLAVFNPQELESAQADLEKNDKKQTDNEKEPLDKNEENMSAEVEESSIDLPVVLSSVIVVILSVSGGFYFFGGKPK